MAKVFGSFSRLVSLLFRKDGQDVTLRPNQSTTYTSARDVQLPPGDAAHTLVSADSTQNLTNKTLTSPVINSPTGITKADVGLSNVDNTSDATKNSAAVSLTNKTIDADLNTITNIENADIKAGAAIDAAKIHDGSVSNTEFGYLNGVTSAIQTQLTANATAISDHLADPTDAHDASAISNVPSGNLAATDVQAALNELQTDVDTRATSSALTAHTGASSGVHGVTGSVVGTTDTQTLTNKLISSTAATTGALTLPAGTEAQRPSPTEGMIRFNTDADEFEGYANGAWSSVGGGVNELPLKNYLKTYATATVSPGILSTVAAAGAVGVDTNVFFSTSTGTAFTLVSSGTTDLRGSNNYLSGANTAANVDGSVFFQFPAVPLETADLGKPISISFDITGITNDQWDVVVARYNSSGTFQGLIPVAGTASSSTSTPSARLPTGTSQFRGFFVSTSDAGHRYALRFRRIQSISSEQIRLDTLYVGPQQQLSGAAVTDWQAYTPTYGAGFGTVSTSQMFWRRDGDSIEIWGRFVAGTTAASSASFTLPSGLSLDTTKLSTNERVLGRWIRNVSTGSAIKGGTVISLTSDSTFLYFGGDSYTDTKNPLVAQNGNAIATSGDSVEVYGIKVPISNWSSNVTMAERAVEEYASNSNATNTATDTTSFFNGPAGSLVPNGAVGTTYTRRVRFQTPIQVTDQFFIDVETGTTGNWIPNRFPYIEQGTNTYGILFNRVNATDVDISFRAGGVVSNGGVYAGNGSAWSEIPTWRWRVRKVSGGAVVGYPVGARNVVGDTTGTAVPVGYIGQVLSANPGAGVTPAASGSYVNVTSVTLTPGVWAVTGVAYYDVGTATGVTDYIAAISLSSAALDVNNVGNIAQFNPNTSAAALPLGPRFITVSSSTVVYLVGRLTYATVGSSGWATISRINAVRIA